MIHRCIGQACYLYTSGPHNPWQWEHKCSTITIFSFNCYLTLEGADAGPAEVCTRKVPVLSATSGLLSDPGCVYGRSIVWRNVYGLLVSRFIHIWVLSAEITNTRLNFHVLCVLHLTVICNIQTYYMQYF